MMYNRLGLNGEGYKMVSDLWGAGGDVSAGAFNIFSTSKNEVVRVFIFCRNLLHTGKD